MLDSVVDALVILSDPSRIAFVVLGTTIGLMIGIIPGIGGLVGLALLLPFTFNMDPYAALAFLIGVSAVTVTSDTIPAVLFGVPGTVGSAATVLDGYPMARRGEAGRAFGAAFSSSVIGGLFGATVLALLIPILQPLLKFIASPELLAICILSFVSNPLVRITYILSLRILLILLSSLKEKMNKTFDKSISTPGK